MDDERCYGCGEQQPDPTDAYKFCFGCFHVYPTAEDLIALDKTWWQEHDLPDPGAISADQIATCPCCTHDF